MLIASGTQAAAMTDKKLDPRVSEFETEAQAESYDRWFRAKVEAAMKSDRPKVPHDEAIARVRATIVRVAATVRSPPDAAGHLVIRSH
jgi:hypothetical protein